MIPDQGRATEPRPRLTRSDGLLLAALLVSAPPGSPADLKGLLGSADYLNTSIPTFDEVSFGLARLAETGWLTLDYSTEDGFLMTAGSAAVELLDAFSVTSAGIRELPAAVQGAIGAAPYPDPEVEDRSVGRMPGLRPEDLAVAYLDHPDVARKWIESRPRKDVR